MNLHSIYSASPALAVVAVAALLVGCSASPNDGGDTGGNDVMNADASNDGDDDTSLDGMSGAIEVGEPCTQPGTCVDEAACVGDSAGDRFRCMLICDEAGRVCADGSFCTARVNAPPVCYTLGEAAEGESCSNNLDCEPGSLCFGAEPEQYCIRGCHVQDDVCSEAEFCDTSSDRGPCRSKLGADCETVDDCADGLACTTEGDDTVNEAFPEGLCTELGCESDSDCPFDGVCRTPPGTQTPVCLQRCSVESDCRFNHDYTCLGPTGCSDTNDRDACGEFLNNEKLCVPDAFSTMF